MAVLPPVPLTVTVPVPVPLAVVSVYVPEASAVSEACGPEAVALMVNWPLAAVPLHSMDTTSSTYWHAPVIVVPEPPGVTATVPSSYTVMFTGPVNTHSAASPSARAEVREKDCVIVPEYEVPVEESEEPDDDPPQETADRTKNAANNL